MQASKLATVYYTLREIKWCTCTYVDNSYCLNMLHAMLMIFEFGTVSGDFFHYKYLYLTSRDLI